MHVCVDIFQGYLYSAKWHLYGGKCYFQSLVSKKEEGKPRPKLTISKIDPNEEARQDDLRDSILSVCFTPVTDTIFSYLDLEATLACGQANPEQWDGIFSSRGRLQRQS